MAEYWINSPKTEVRLRQALGIFIEHYQVEAKIFHKIPIDICKKSDFLSTFALS